MSALALNTVLDSNGLVTSWRDYLDRKEPEAQIRRFVKGGQNHSVR